MEPLAPVPMPTHAVLLELTRANTWRSPAQQQQGLYLAYIATNSTEPISFVSLNSAAADITVVSLLSRRAHAADYSSGVVVELRLAHALSGTQSVQIALAQCGATTYYPAQPISD